MKSWEKIRQQRPTHVKLSYDGEYPKSNSADHDQFEFKRHGENMLFMEKRNSTIEGKTTNVIECWVVNEHYAFVVNRVSEDSGWMLSRFRMAGTEDYQKFAERLRLFEATTCFPGVTVKDAYLWEIVDNTNCEFVENEGDQDRCRLVFRRKGAEPFRTGVGLKFWPKEGTIVLNKQNGWVVESAVLLDSKGNEETVQYTYGERSDFVPVETVAESEVLIIKKRLTEHGFDNRSVESDYRLAAFGLPEPSGVPSSGPRWLWYVGVCAVFLLFVGGWLVRRR